MVFEVEKCEVHDRDNFDASCCWVSRSGGKGKGAWELVMAMVLLRQGSRHPAESWLWAGNAVEWC